MSASILTRGANSRIEFYMWWPERAPTVDSRHCCTAVGLLSTNHLSPHLPIFRLPSHLPEKRRLCAARMNVASTPPGPASRWCPSKTNFKSFCVVRYRYHHRFPFFQKLHTIYHAHALLRSQKSVSCFSSDFCFCTHAQRSVSISIDAGS